MASWFFFVVVRSWSPGGRGRPGRNGRRGRCALSLCGIYAGMKVFKRGCSGNGCKTDNKHNSEKGSHECYAVYSEEVASQEFVRPRNALKHRKGSQAVMPHSCLFEVKKSALPEACVSQVRHHNAAHTIHSYCVQAARDDVR